MIHNIHQQHRMSSILGCARPTKMILPNRTSNTSMHHTVHIVTFLWLHTYRTLGNSHSAMWVSLLCRVELILLQWSCYCHIPVVSLLVRASPTAQNPAKKNNKNDEFKFSLSLPPAFDHFHFQYRRARSGKLCHVWWCQVDILQVRKSPIAFSLQICIPEAIKQLGTWSEATISYQNSMKFCNDRFYRRLCKHHERPTAFFSVVVKNSMARLNREVLGRQDRMLWILWASSSLQHWLSVTSNSPSTPILWKNWQIKIIVLL